MIIFNLFNSFNTKKKIAVIGLLILALLLILVNYNRELIKSYIDEVVKSPSIRIHLINIAKVVIPLKNHILMRNVNDKIALLKSSGSCVFCNLTQGNFKGNDLEGVDLRYAILIGADLSNANLSRASLSNVNLSEANLSNTNLNGAILHYTNLSGANLDGADLSEMDLTGTILTYANLSGTNLDGFDLSNTDLTGTILTYANLSGANLDGVDLSNTDLTGTILTYANLSGTNLDGVDLSNTDLTGVNLSGVDLSNTDLTGTILTYANLSGANLDGVNLSNTDLTRVNLSNTDLTGTILTYANLSEAQLYGVDLSNTDLTGTILTYANLSGANLDGVNLSNKDLTGVNLTGVNLINNDLTGAILKDAKKIEIRLNKSLNYFNLPVTLNKAFDLGGTGNIDKFTNETKNLNITRYDLSGDVQYLATFEGLLFELKNNESRLVLDLERSNKSGKDGTMEKGILGVASQNKLVYVAYTIQDINAQKSLFVDEYSMNFTKVRNILRIDKMKGHFGGALLFDSLGRLYLSVGVDSDDRYGAQDLNSLRGKILRLDVSKLKLEPEIVAYGVREPWGVTIDSKDRMFILQCGDQNVEAIYLLNDLYSGIPANLGWPVFEGSMRKKKDPLMFKDVLAPIFETNSRPGCLTAGIYLDDIESFLFGDYFGNIGLLKQKENGEWYLLYEYKQGAFIWSFGLDKKTKKILIAPKNIELEITVNQVKFSH